MYPLKPFESCLEKITYTVKIQRKDFLESGDFPVISQESEFINGYWNNENDLFKIKKPVVIFGDHTQVFKYVDFDFVLGADGVKILQPKDFLDTKFFYYFLQSVDLGSLGYARHYRLLKEIQIPLPPLTEQLRIVSILDEALEKLEQTKENIEKNIQNAKGIFESYLQNIFANPWENWEEKTLKEISLEFGRGKSKHRPRNDKKLYGGNYPFIQTGDIRNSGHLIEKYSQTYNEAWLIQSKLWSKGTICITIAANIAETGVLNFDACFPDSIIGLVADPKKASEDFVEYLLYFFKTRIQSKSKWSAQANINLGTFEYEKFPIPPVLEQLSIVSQLDTLSTETKRLEAIYLQKLAYLDELRKSLLKKAFNGEF